MFQGGCSRIMLISSTEQGEIHHLVVDLSLPREVGTWSVRWACERRVHPEMIPSLFDSILLHFFGDLSLPTPSGPSEAANCTTPVPHPSLSCTGEYADQR